MYLSKSLWMYEAVDQLSNGPAACHSCPAGSTPCLEASLDDGNAKAPGSEGGPATRAAIILAGIMPPGCIDM